LKGPSGVGLVQHRIDRGFARSIHAVRRIGASHKRNLAFAVFNT
jgi:hypothetical protein